MIRRNFLKFLALSGSTAIAPLQAIASSTARTVIFQVKGFTCVTCAVGLDTMMARNKGVVSSQSTYPEGRVTVRFNPATIHLETLKAVITDAGFTISEQQLDS